MNARERDSLLESAVGARRARDSAGRILPADGWLDLPPDDRDALFEVQRAIRVVERAISRDGLSGTAQAVLERIRPR